MPRPPVAPVSGVGLAAGSSSAIVSTADHPQIISNVVFQYYKDTTFLTAARFYEEVLGLKKTYDKPGVKMYELTQHSAVGLIKENTGGYFKAPSVTPAVMISIETEQFDEWYRQLKARNATFLGGKHKTELVDSYMVKDPGGYTVEIFRWENK
jgi:predicted enzyme related to lactoylglutathione lyase